MSVYGNHIFSVRLAPGNRGARSNVGQCILGDPVPKSRSLALIHHRFEAGAGGNHLRQGNRDTRQADSKDGPDLNSTQQIVQDPLTRADRYFRHQICSKSYLAARDLTKEILGRDDFFDIDV